MLKRTLGKSKLEVRALGMGCWAIGERGHSSARTRIHPLAGETQTMTNPSAQSCRQRFGCKFFDTAANYGAGHSEVVLGRALKGKRDNVVIATKFGHIVNEKEKTVYGDRDQIIDNVRTDVENSLRRLQTDYIDIYQLHDGGYDPRLALELQSVLEELVSAGKIRWYGWSTDVVDSAREFATGTHCTSIQFRLNAIYDNLEMRKVCMDFDLAGINKDPLNKGFLTGKFNAASTFPENDVRYGTDFSDPEIVGNCV
jgi:aryl-alcohol dehydrogenase-like predicted oxidoreductase